MRIMIAIAGTDYAGLSNTIFLAQHNEVIALYWILNRSHYGMTIPSLRR